MHALLGENEEDMLVLVQDPWFDCIGAWCCDSIRGGVNVLGAAAHPNWDVHYPSWDAECRAKVVAYSCKHALQNPLWRSPLKFIACPDVGPCHPCFQVIDVVAGHRTLWVINFYHDVNNPLCLDALLRWDPDNNVMSILVGDFNTHSLSWNATCLDQSPWSGCLETWMADHTFQLRSEPGAFTHCGRDNEWPSALDLVWHNFACSVSLLLLDPIINWAASFGSDHTSIHSTWVLDDHLCSPNNIRPAGFNLDIGG